MCLWNSFRSSIPEVKKQTQQHKSWYTKKSVGVYLLCYEQFKFMLNEA